MTGFPSSLPAFIFAAFFTLPLSNPPAAAQTSDQKPKEGDFQRDVTAERERRKFDDENALVRRFVKQAEADVKQALTVLDDLERTAAALQARLDELMTSDSGKRLGQDRGSFLRIQRLRDVPIVSPDQIEAKRLAAREIKATLDQELQLDAVGHVPKKLERREALEIQYWAKERLAALKEHDRWLTSALEAAPRDLDPAKAKTLDQLIRDYEAERFRIWDSARHEGELRGREESRQIVVDAARIAELERAQVEAQKRLEEARLEIERLKLTIDAERKRAAIEQQDLMAQLEREQKLAEARRKAEQIKVAVDAEQTVDAAEKLRLKQKCQDPQVLQLLAPFTTPGYVQPGSSRIEPDKRPVSLQALQASGCLAPTREGLGRLLAIGRSKEDKVRPRWQIRGRSIDSLAPEDLEHIKRVQKLLCELGPTLVEEGKLSP